MDIRAITEDKLDVICAICLDPSVNQETKDITGSTMDGRIAWIKKRMSIGLEILVALEDPREEKMININ